MSWYKKYLEVYEKPYTSIDTKTIEHVAAKIKERKSDNPIISVVIIGRNEATRLLGCLWSVADNNVEVPYEIIYIDNNSTDDSQHLLKRLGVTYFVEEKLGQGYARQCGLDNCKGTYYFSMDSDTLYPSTFIQTHYNKIQLPNVVLTYSFWGFIPTEKTSRLQFFIYESFRNLFLRIQNIKRPQMNVRGCATLYIVKYAKEEGYNTTIRRGEDGKMATSLSKKGKIKLLTSSKARPLTCSDSLGVDQPLYKSLFYRLKLAIQRLTILHKSIGPKK